jgi:hypothetical protein
MFTELLKVKDMKRKLNSELFIKKELNQLFLVKTKSKESVLLKEQLER